MNIYAIRGIFLQINMFPILEHLSKYTNVEELNSIVRKPYISNCTLVNKFHKRVMKSHK